MGAVPVATSTYQYLLDLLTEHGADFDLVDHEPLGATEEVSALRGHPAAWAAKALMVVVKLDRRQRKYVLAVVPGDRRVDLDAVRRYYGARYAGVCETGTAERLAGTPSGTILPLAVHEEVELLADPAVLEQPQLYFNAARLDRSVRMATADWARIARPVLHPIAAAHPGESPP
jgi:Ala-tRNA(Pro) deacylase